MLSTRRRTPRSQVSSVLPRISTDLTYTVSSVAALRTSILILRIRLLTFCTLQRAMRARCRAHRTLLGATGEQPDPQYQYRGAQRSDGPDPIRQVGRITRQHARYL